MEGWPETYTVEGSVIDAQMRADPDQSARLRELRIVTESGLPVLETEQRIRQSIGRTTNMIIMRTYFQSSIPDTLHEAAVLDGCNYTRYLLRIVLPLSMPIIAVVGLYYAVGHWNMYFDALIYLRSTEKQNLQLVLRNILLANQVNSGDGSFSESAKLGVTIKYAVIVVSCIPMMIAYPFVQKFFVKGVMIGALKG